MGLMSHIPQYIDVQYSNFDTFLMSFNIGPAEKLSGYCELDTPRLFRPNAPFIFNARPCSII